MLGQPQMMSQPGVPLHEQIMSYGSINSYNSQDSIGSGSRGAAMSKAFQKAQQQVQSGMLSEAQVCHTRWRLSCQMQCGCRYITLLCRLGCACCWLHGRMTVVDCCMSLGVCRGSRFRVACCPKPSCAGCARPAAGMATQQWQIAGRLLDVDRLQQDASSSTAPVCGMSCQGHTGIPIGTPVFTCRLQRAGPGGACCGCHA